MPTTNGRDRRRQALRDTILDAARRLIREGGLHALTMRRLAEAIDYSPASLYTHFASREALLAALCGQGYAALREALEATAAEVPDPVARLTALGLAYVGHARANPDTYRLIFMADAALTQGVFEALDSPDGERSLALLATALVEAGGDAAEAPRWADLLWTTVHGIASLRLACPAVPATDDAALVALAVRGVLAGAQAGTPSS